MAHAHVRRLSALLAAALLSATTACTVASDAATEPGSPSEPTATANSSIRMPADPGPYLTTRELRGALLGKDDLPKGWPTTALGAKDSAGSSGVGEGCERLSDYMNPRSSVYSSQAMAGVFAEAPSDEARPHTLVGVELVSLEDARRVIPTVREALPGCSEQKINGIDGRGTAAARELEAPRLGDESVALVFTVRFDDGGGTAHSIVLVRVGTTMIRLTGVSLTGTTPHHPDPAMVRKQVEQVEAATRAKADETSPGV